MKITVSVKAGAKKDLVEPGEADTLRVWVRAAAREGKANAAVEKLLAAYFGIPWHQVSIVQGRTSRQKVVEIKR